MQAPRRKVQPVSDELMSVVMRCFAIGPEQGSNVMAMESLFAWRAKNDWCEKQVDYLLEQVLVISQFGIEPTAAQKTFILTGQRSGACLFDGPAGMMFLNIIMVYSRFMC